MGKYELTISKNYVPDWGVVEAVRELFQNALDQETISKNNSMFFSYDEENEVLEIGNKESVLEASSLLLGNTTKLNDEVTIGQFGEGYKIAMLILLRNNINIKVANYGKKEIWKPRFVNSRRYGQEILTVFTEKMIWSKPPDNSLIISLDGVTSEMYEKIVESNLHLQGDISCKISKKYGRVLTDKNYKGNIYVNGLFITTNSELDYGYDFLPSVLKLRRDRSMVDDFDLRNTTTSLWENLIGEETPAIVKMITDNSRDISLMQYSFSAGKKVSTDVYDKFREQHGENSIAISNNTEIHTFMEEHPDSKPIVVQDNMYKIISNDPRNSEEIDRLTVEIDRTAIEKLELWYKKLTEGTYVSSTLKEEFHEILKELS